MLGVDGIVRDGINNAHGRQSFTSGLSGVTLSRFWSLLFPVAAKRLPASVCSNAPEPLRRTEQEATQPRLRPP